MPFLPLAGSTYTTSIPALSKFIIGLQGVSPGNLRRIWIPTSGDTTTNLSLLDGLTWTYDATIAARISAQGSGVLVSFASGNQFANMPNAADLTFNGTVDAPFSIAMLANVTNTAQERDLLGKWVGNNYEYQFAVTAADKLVLKLANNGFAVNVASRLSDAVITQGALHLFGSSYAGTGGATAANGITLYQDASAIASTATNDASYSHMAHKSGLLYLGASQDAPSVTGASASIGMMGLFAAELSAAQHLAVKTAVNAYFGLSL